jgi:hypothetical protein
MAAGIANRIRREGFRVVLMGPSYLLGSLDETRASPTRLDDNGERDRSGIRDWEAGGMDRDEAIRLLRGGFQRVAEWNRGLRYIEGLDLDLRGTNFSGKFLTSETTRRSDGRRRR